MKKIGCVLLFLSFILNGCAISNEETQVVSDSVPTIKSSLEPERKSNMNLESSDSSNEISENSNSDSENKTEVTKDQKEILVVFTQQELDDRDISYKYKGYDTWNVVTNDTSELKKFIITTKDAKAGRIKSIYEWDGKKDSGAKLIYLLVGGDELVNNLRK